MTYRAVGIRVGKPEGGKNGALKVFHGVGVFVVFMVVP